MKWPQFIVLDIYYVNGHLAILREWPLNTGATLLLFGIKIFHFNWFVNRTILLHLAPEFLETTCRNVWRNGKRPPCIFTPTKQSETYFELNKRFLETVLSTIQKYILANWRVSDPANSWNSPILWYGLLQERLRGSIIPFIKYNNLLSLEDQSLIL